MTQAEMFPEIQSSYKTVDEKLVRMMYNHYRQRGFPYPFLDREDKLKEFDSLQMRSTAEVINGEFIESDSTGVSLANFYQPHRFDVPCRKMRIATEVFRQPISLEKVIRKTYALCGKCTDAALLSTICIFNGVQVASNFPPGTAKAIYEQYCKDGKVWDMSCGFGGRLLGAACSPNINLYIGTEPSTKTMTGLIKMIQDLKEIGRFGINTQLQHHGSEIPFESPRVSLCFTSPPYFNCEKYSTEETQSYLKYPYHSDWIKHFMTATLVQCHEKLHEGGFLIINIANVETFNDLTDRTVRVAIEIGFHFVEEKKLLLSTMPGGGRNQKKRKENSKAKSEPVFIFQKGVQ